MLNKQTLESDRSFLFHRESELRQQLERSNAEQLAKTSAMEAKLNALSSKYNALSERHSLESAEAADAVSALQEQCLQSQIQCESMTNRLQESQSILRDQMEQVRQRQSAINKLDSHQPRHPITAVASEVAEEQQMLSRQLKEQESLIQQLETKLYQAEDKLRFYKAINENVERLKEEKASLEHQLSLFSDTRTQLSEARMTIASFEAQQSRWNTFLKDVGLKIGVNSPLELAQLVSKQRFEILSLHEELGALKAASRQSYTGSLEDEVCIRFFYHSSLLI